jgi:hypothetical protein
LQYGISWGAKIKVLEPERLRQDITGNEGRFKGTKGEIKSWVYTVA